MALGDKRFKRKQITSKFYGLVNNTELRYDCPECTDTKGRFFLNRNTQKFICHNCGIRGQVSEFAVEQFKKAETGELKYAGMALSEVDASEYKVRLDLEDDKEAFTKFMSSRGFQDVEQFPVIPMCKNVQYRNRLAIKCTSILSTKEFWNLRDITGKADKKVLFPKTCANIARKSNAVLWNPAVNIKELLITKGSIIPVVVEGDMAALSVFRKLGNNYYIGLAVFGKDISAAQARYLSSFKEVLYMPDADTTTKEQEKAINKLMLGGCEEVKVYQGSQYLDGKDDANDIFKRQGNWDWFNPSTFTKRSVSKIKLKL